MASAGEGGDDTGHIVAKSAANLLCTCGKLNIFFRNVNVGKFVSEFSSNYN